MCLGRITLTGLALAVGTAFLPGTTQGQHDPTAKADPGHSIASVADVTAAVEVSQTASTAIAQRTAKRVGPEVAVGGRTTAERVAKTNKLRAELDVQRPPGTLDTPVRVVLTAQERAALAVQPIVNGHAPLRIGMTKPLSPRIGKDRGTDFGFDMPGKFVETEEGA